MRFRLTPTDDAFLPRSELSGRSSRLARQHLMTRSPASVANLVGSTAAVRIGAGQARLA
jgi:hypothetical protein